MQILHEDISYIYPTLKVASIVAVSAGIIFFNIIGIDIYLYIDGNLLTVTY